MSSVSVSRTRIQFHAFDLSALSSFASSEILVLQQKLRDVINLIVILEYIGYNK